MTEKRNLKKAALISGIDEEIDLLRVKLRSVVKHDPENVRLILQAVVSLARLLRTRQFLSKTDEGRFAAAMQNVFTYIAAPLGIDIAKLISSKYKTPAP